MAHIDDTRMEETPPTKRSTAAAVPVADDMLLEIFLRFKNNPATLFRCATACKRWRRLVADPTFLRHCWPSAGSGSNFFVGFFTKKRHYLGKETGFCPVYASCFVPVPRSPMGPCRRALGSFVPSAPSGLLDHAVPISSRHGLLLVDLADAYPSAPIFHLAVCNPLSGTCESLPPLPRDLCDQGYTRYAILTDAENHIINVPEKPTMPHFKVLVVDLKYNINIYMFSSNKGSWCHASCSSWLNGAKTFHVCQTDAVVRGVMAHWLFYNFTIMSCLCTIDVNSETGRVSTTKIMMLTEQSPLFRCAYDKPCVVLAVDSGGELSLLWLQTEHLQVEIWKRQDKNGSVVCDSMRHCTRVVLLKQPSRMEFERRKLCILGEKCGTILVNDRHQRVHIAHLETGVMEEVTNWPASYLNQGEPVCFEMDWRALFVYRLHSRYKTDMHEDLQL